MAPEAELCCEYAGGARLAKASKGRSNEKAEARHIGRGPSRQQADFERCAISFFLASPFASGGEDDTVPYFGVMACPTESESHV